MMKVNCGQSRAAFGMSVGLPISGVSTGEGEKPLWMQMLKKPGMLLELLLVARDQLVGRVDDLLVVEPPAPHRAVRIVVGLGGERDVVALPGIGMVLLDLPLHELEVRHAGIELAVREHALRARDAVDEVADRRGLARREVHDLLRLGVVHRRAALRVAGREDAERGGAEQPDRDLAVEVDVLDEAAEVQRFAVDRLAGAPGVEHRPRPAELVDLAFGLERVLLERRSRRRRRALHEGEEHVRPVLARAHHVQLVVEHEQVARRRVRQRGVGLVELVAVDVEELAVDLVHGEKARGDAAGAGQEAAPTEAQPAPDRVGEVGDAVLDPLLLGGLRDRHVLAVRDHAGRHRRMEIVHLVGAGQLRELLVAQPDIFLAVSSRRHPGLLRCVVRLMHRPLAGRRAR